MPHAGFAPMDLHPKRLSRKWILAATIPERNVVINEGTLALAAGASLGFPAVITVESGAVLDVSDGGGMTLAFGQVLQGRGSVVGNITDGNSIIRPGGAGTMGTLVFSNALYLNGGNTLEMDLAAETTAGEEVNDLLVVHGDLDLSSVTLKINFTGAAMGGKYRLINYYGTLLGSPNIIVSGWRTTLLGTMHRTPDKSTGDFRHPVKPHLGGRRQYQSV